MCYQLKPTLILHPPLMLQIRSRSDGGKYLKGCGTTAWNIGEDVPRSDGGKYFNRRGTAARNIICSQHLCMLVTLQCRKEGEQRFFYI